MLDSSFKHHTANMKLLLLAVICLTTALAIPPPAKRYRRGILPGDSRFGTDYNHENEIQISKAFGGYVGSYDVPTSAQKLYQTPTTNYGPPNYKPGNPIQLPSTNYGVPDSQTKTVVDKKTISSDYQAPKIDAPVTSYQASSANAEVNSSDQVLINSYGTPVEKANIETVEENTNVDSSDVETNIENSEIEQEPSTKTTAEEQNTETEVNVASDTEKEVNTVNTKTTETKTTATAGFSGTFGVTGVSKVNTEYGTNFGSIDGYKTVRHGQIPVKTVDHHVHVKVPQPYPYPVTKHVPYPVPVPHAVEVPRPYYISVPQPVQVHRTVEVPHQTYQTYAHQTAYPYVPSVHTQVPHQVVQVDAKGNPVTDFLQDTFGNYDFSNFQLPSFPSAPSFPSLPSVPSFPSLPSVPSFPSLPSFPGNFPSQPTGSQGEVQFTGVSGSTDSVTVDNPLTNVQTTLNHETKKEYVQPTDSNGGYIY